MNIVVRTHSGRSIVRPDTTWEKDSDDLYPQEFVHSLSFTPVLFAKVCKAGRSVAARFAERYYDSIGYGMLLYPDDLLDGSEEGFACASCLDHSSFLTIPLLDKECTGCGGFTIEAAGRIVADPATGSREMICRAIEAATSHIYIRRGDFIAIELAPRMPLCSDKDGAIPVKGRFAERTVLDFNIIF